MKVIFSILIFLFVVIPLGGFAFLMYYIIKKSSDKKSPEFLLKQKNEMFKKVLETKTKLVPWKKEYLVQFSNDFNFNFLKGFARKFNGIIKNSDGENIIAFRRLDRGMHNDSRIVATTSEKTFYFEEKSKTNYISIFINNQFFGKIINRNLLYNDKEDRIGKISRNITNKGIYEVVFNTKIIAEIIKNSDRRMFTKNPFYDRHSSFSTDKTPYFQKNPTIENSLVFVNDNLSDYEYDWVLALGIYECVYYGIDFTE